MQRFLISEAAKRAQKIQEKIYYDMPDTKKINIVSQFFMLAHALKNSKTVLKNDSTGTAYGDK
jgi:hypothetical protein